VHAHSNVLHSHHAPHAAHVPQIRHCALSLVGEPIMYPRINELVRLLHGNGISTFL